MRYIITVVSTSHLYATPLNEGAWISAIEARAETQTIPLTTQRCKRVASTGRSREEANSAEREQVSLPNGTEPERLLVDEKYGF